MATHLDIPMHDDPHDQELRGRRYGWELVLYVSFALLILMLFLMVR